MKKNTVKSLILAGLLGTAGSALLTSCGGGIADKETAASSSQCSTVNCYLDAISDAEWTQAEENLLIMEMEKVAASGSTGKDNFQFRWKDKNGTLIHRGGYTDGPVFEAGKPYVIHFKSPVSTNNNSQEHYFTAYTGTGTSGLNFYRGIAVHKIETEEMIYKVPYILDFELNAPTDNKTVAGTPRQTEAKIYFVPVTTGTYMVVCKDGNHSQQSDHTGMVSTMTITGGLDTYPDYELDSAFNSTVWVDDQLNQAWTNRRSNSNILPWATVTNTASATCHGEPSTVTTGCKCNGAIPAGTVTGTAYAAGTASGLASVATCSTGTLSPSSTALVKNIYLTEASGEVTVAPAGVETLTFGSDLLTNTDATKSKRYQLRFQKASGSTGNYVVESSFFRNVVVRKIHDRHVQLKPVYLTLMEFKTGASANNLDATVGSEDIYTKPGAFEVDLFFVADSQYSVTNGTSAGGGSATDYSINVSIGTGTPKATNFTVSPWAP